MGEKIDEIQTEYVITDENSKIFRDLNIPLLFGTSIKILKNKIVITVQSSAQADLLKEHSQKITRYFKKNGIDFFIKDPIPIVNEKTNMVSVSKAELNGYINQDYIETPYITGPSNELAFAMKSRILESSGVMYCFGETGTGKSHLLHLLAHEALIKKNSVFIRNGNEFVEYIKDEYFKNSTIFMKTISSFDFVIIDDFQYLNKKELSFMHDPLFEILNQQILKGKKLVFSSDNSPYISSTYYHERITSRLMSGYICKIDIPDMGMKKTYVDYFCSKNNINVPEEIKLFVVNIGKNLRAVRAILGYCQVLYEQDQLYMDKLIEMTQKIYGSPAGIRKSREEKFFHEVYNVLREYYGISEEEAHSSGTRKPRIVSTLDSVVYYILKDIIKDKKLLRNLLKMKNNIESYYVKKGEGLYLKIDERARKQLENIINSHLDEERKIEHGEQGVLWEK